MVRLSSLAKNLTAETAFTVLALARTLQARGKDVVELEIGDSPFPSTPNAKRERAPDTGRCESRSPTPATCTGSTSSGSRPSTRSTPRKA